MISNIGMYCASNETSLQDFVTLKRDCVQHFHHYFTLVSLDTALYQVSLIMKGATCDFFIVSVI